MQVGSNIWVREPVAITTCLCVFVESYLLQLLGLVPSSCTVGSCRSVFCCVGVDCVNVHQIVHWGVASNVESYVQETGRAGRDGRVACATLFYKVSDLDS